VPVIRLAKTMRLRFNPGHFIAIKFHFRHGYDSFFSLQSIIYSDHPVPS
jgi:hypothetical protein